MGDLGDLSGFLKEGNVAKLDWLDVDEAEYRKLDTLPKQNLDIAPDLQAIWAHEDKSSTTYLVPNTGPVKPFPGAGDVHTMGDLSEAHGALRGSKGEDLARDTRYAMMVSQNPANMRTALTRKYPLSVLQANRGIIASVLAERGLVGGVYIEAKDFPGCHNSPRVTQAFVRKHACDAKYIKSKPECGGCIHAKKLGNKTNCAVFHKEVVLDVPYTEQLATEVASLNTQRGKTLQASTGLSPKERIRLAVLQESPQAAPAVYQGIGENQLAKPVSMTSENVQQQLVAASALTRKRDEQVGLSLKSKPIVAFIRRELLKGRTATELVSALKVSFPMQDLAQTRKEWEPHFKEAGLYGAIYSTQDSFNECRDGADFIAKHNPGIRAMVAGAKCGSCIYNKISRCMLYGKPLVKEASDLYTWPTVEAVLQEHRTAGRIEQWEKTAAGLGAPDPRSALKLLHARATGSGPKQEGTYSNRMDLFHAWAGNRTEHSASGQVKRNIVKTASRYLNEGLYGADLMRALKAMYEVRDLTAARDDLRAVISEQGLQGIYYVDASVYDDYGHGCEEPARLFRAKNVKYAKLGSKCGSCVHNHNNHCAKLNKPLVVEPPYLDKKAEQEAMLNSGPSTRIDEASLMAPSGLSMIHEYQLQNGGMTIDLDPVTAAVQPVEIMIGRQKVRV